MTFIGRQARGGAMAQSNPSLLPRRGPARLRAIDGLEAALVADTAGTLADMVTNGWPVESALDAYRAWLHGLIDAAVDEGLVEWLWQAA
jgi:hypothetical protein